MRLYFLSGLGADKRVFDRMTFEGYDCIYIEWIQPDARDSLGIYAKKLAKQIDQSEDFALIGVSFGGMLASKLNEICLAKSSKN